MGRIVISIFVGICFIGSAYGTQCSPGPGYRFPITCPGESNSTKSYCCEIGGSFRCCDKEEFVSQEGRSDNANPPILRVKREWSTYESSYTTAAVGLTTAGIIYIILGIAIPISLICCCCCCCCACCPCYAWCHPNHSTAVTIVQPSGGYPGGSTQNNFSINVPTHSQPGMAQDLPPKYNEGGYTTLSSTNPQQNYIQ